MRKAGLIGIIHINLDFSGTDLANGTKVSDYVHPKAPARSKPIPRVLVETAGKKRAVWQMSQFGRSTIWMRCRSWRSGCVQKNGDVGFPKILSSRSLETLNMAVRLSDNHVQPAESTRSALR